MSRYRLLGRPVGVDPSPAEHKIRGDNAIGDEIELDLSEQEELARVGFRCEHRGLFGRCRVVGGHRLQVHHLHYRELGHESSASLRVLCRAHHAVADRRRRRRGG